MYERINTITVKTGTQAGSIASTFDAILAKPQGNAVGLPWHLLINLRIRLSQRNPSPWPFAQDSAGEVFYSDMWPPDEWSDFLDHAKVEANLWHEQFWLKPPDSFTDGDVQIGSNAVWTPYINCQCVVQFDQPNPHRSIPVVHLNAAIEGYKAKQAFGKLGPPFDRPNGKTFQSNAVLWDSLDGIPGVSFYDDANKKLQYAVGFTITHEIGHALGLDHIGVVKKVPLCVMAQALNWSIGGSDMPLVGGANASVCYGEWHWNNSLGGDVMGMGTDFSDADGLPWVWAMTQLRSRSDESWEVLLQDAHKEKGFTHPIRVSPF
jgi:hypothetical protein